MSVFGLAETEKHLEQKAKAREEQKIKLEDVLEFMALVGEILLLIILAAILYGLTASGSRHEG